jgi:thioredoxin-dependent peroxiredoxin
MRRGVSSAAILMTFCSLPAVAALKIGDKAPAFTLPATTGKQVSLADYAGKNVVLFGFIGAFTPT